VPVQRGPVFAGADDGHLELARQKSELGVQRAPLAQNFGKRARVGHLVGGDAGQRVGADVADAVAAGLDAVHIDAGQQLHDLGRVLERNPVELHVLARGEVAVTGGQAAGDGAAVAQLHRAEPVLRRHRALEHGRAGLVVNARNLCQRPHLRARQLTVGHGDAQHGSVALDVPAVLQPQWLKGFVGQGAVAVALPLVAELGRALADELAVKIGVGVHAGGQRR